MPLFQLLKSGNVKLKRDNFYIYINAVNTTEEEPL